MSNAASSHRHGLTKVNQTRPKSKLRKRANKFKANARKVERRVILGLN